MALLARRPPPPAAAARFFLLLDEEDMVASGERCCRWWIGSSASYAVAAPCPLSAPGRCPPPVVREWWVTRRVSLYWNQPLGGYKGSCSCPRFLS